MIDAIEAITDSRRGVVLQLGRLEDELTADRRKNNSLRNVIQDLELMRLAQDGDQWQTLVNTVINIQIP
jgi:hypothetical protein